jgi:hypothetical protein
MFPSRAKAHKLLRMRTASLLIFLLGGLVAFAGPVSCGYAAPAQNVSYGTRVKYSTGEKIEFPDFTIAYVGERRKSLPVYPRGFIYYDFKISNGNTEKMISWTSGTGLIGPMQFEMGEKHYQLELRHSHQLGKLADNEVVIWRAK